MLLTNRFNQIDSQINQVESDIAKLQNQLSELQQHRQHLQAVEQACESALTQTETALMMLNHIDPDCVQTFKAAMLAKFDGTISQLPEATDTDTPESEPINPIEPDTDDTDTITVDPILESPEIDTTPESEPRTLASVGCAVFNPSTADFDNLKAWVRSHQTDDATRLQGTLTRRTTWEHAAKLILESL
jgi:TolA-binding protein